MIIKVIRNLLSGAFPEPEYDELSVDEQYFPEDGLVLVPDFAGLETQSIYGDPAGPKVTLNVAVGSRIAAGHPVALVELNDYVIEIASPCDATIVEIFMNDGEAAVANQPIARISNPDLGSEGA